MSTDIICKRCGVCCHYYKDGELHACKHLVKLPQGRTLCRIYPKRLNCVIDHLPDGRFVVCLKREQQLYNYPDCPYNKPNNPKFQPENDN